MKTRINKMGICRCANTLGQIFQNIITHPSGHWWMDWPSKPNIFGMLGPQRSMSKRPTWMSTRHTKSQGRRTGTVLLVEVYGKTLPPPPPSRSRLAVNREYKGHHTKWAIRWEQEAYGSISNFKKKRFKDWCWTCLPHINTDKNHHISIKWSFFFFETVFCILLHKVIASWAGQKI